MPGTWPTSLQVQALFFFKAMVRNINYKCFKCLFIYLFIYSFIMLIVIVNNYVTKMHSDLHAPSLHMSLHNFIYYECGQLLYMRINC